MNLFEIALRSLQQRSLSSILTMISVALGVGLIVGVLVIYGVVDGMFSSTGTGYDLLIGPKGSRTQLVLSAIYRIEPPIENLPYRFFLDMQDHPHVETAIPINIGDTTKQGFPIVGTTPEFFLLPYARDGAGNPHKFRMTGMMNGMWDAIIGSEVAQANGWDIGSEFQMVHGGNTDDGHVHDEKFTVRGVMAPTNTPNDRSVFVNIAGFLAIGGHDTPIDQAVAREADFYGETIEQVRTRHAEDIAKVEAVTNRGGIYEGPTPVVAKEVTAVLVTMKRDPDKPRYLASSKALKMQSDLQKGFQAQAVNPVQVMTRLVESQIGDIKNVMLILTALIVVVSANGIFVSIYNSMADRRKEIGIMRALGARRETMLGIIMAETILLCLGGGLLGFVAGHGLVFAAAPWIAEHYKLLIDPWHFEIAELAIFPVLLLLAVIVGILPGLTAYQTDVASALAD